MGTLLEKAQQEDAKRIKAVLDAATGGLAPGSPERRASYQKTLEDIADAVPKSEPGRSAQERSAWDFTAEKAQPVFAECEDVIIRPIRIDDADFYVGIKAQYSAMYRRMAQTGHVGNQCLLRDDLLKPRSFFCVVEIAVDHTPIGYIGIKNTLDEMWEIAVELDGKYTRRGYGAKSIRLFLNEIHRITGHEEFRAVVETDNAPSQKCFERLGATLVGIVNGPFLMLEEEKRRFEENNLDLIDDNMRLLAERLGVEPRKLLSHVLDYRIKCPI